MKTAFLLLGLIFTSSAMAELKEQKNIKFPIIGADLMKGDIHYSFTLVNPKALKKKYKYLRDLDSLKVRKEPNAKVIIAKAVFAVKTQIGFFDHEHMKNIDYLRHIRPGQQVTEVNTNTFTVSVPGPRPYTYTLKTYFDSDDISSLPTAKVVSAMTAAKKIDVISQSASSIVFDELTNFSDIFLGQTSVTTYMGLKEQYTLVMHYKLAGVRSSFAKKSVLKKMFTDEMLLLQDSIETFQKKQGPEGP